MNSVEKWRDIKGYKGYYQISNKGKVKSLIGWNGHAYVKREKILKPSLTTTGYWKVELMKNKQKKSKRVHRLIATAFIPNPENKPQINHIDGNPLNNSIDNLEWSTQKENVHHAIKIGLKAKTYIPKKELEHLYIKENKSLAEIGQIYNVSRTLIADRLREYDIGVRNISEAKIKYGLTKDFIIRELKTKSQKELAKEIGCDQSLISHYLKRIKRKGKIYA